MKNLKSQVCLCFVLSLFLVGCQRSEQIPLGKVAGKVTLNGKPLGEGRITFSSSEQGVAAMASLNSDGSYVIEIPLRLGEYHAAVAGPAAPLDNWVPGEPLPPPLPTPIPKRYWDVNTSGLAYIVKQGKNQIDIDVLQ